MSDVELLVLPGAEAAAEAVAGYLVEGVDQGGHIAVSGGSSPRPAYQRAAALRRDWSRVELWLADERCVPPTDERSNWKLVEETLLAGLEQLPVLHRVRGELAPEAAAAEYDEALAGVTLDLAILGVGPDGHTCSLFPGKPAVEERQRRAVATEAGLDPFVPRVTLTVPMVSASRLVVYLVTGEAKADAALRAFAQPPSPETPASLVRGRRTVAVLDEAAAALLPR